MAVLTGSIVTISSHEGQALTHVAIGFTRKWVHGRMTIVVSLLIGGVLGWFARDGVQVARKELGRRRRVKSERAAIHTMRGADEWQVRREGDEEPLATFPTKAQAQTAGRETAKQAGTEHVVHRVDDTISERRDYSGERPPA